MPLYEYEHIKTGKRIEVIQSSKRASSLFWRFIWKILGYQRVFSCNVNSAYNTWGSSLEKQLMGDFSYYEKTHGTGSVEKATRMSLEKIKNGVKTYVNTYNSEKKMNGE